MASAIFSAVTMRRTLHKACRDSSFVLDKGEMGLCPEFRVYWKREGCHLVSSETLAQTLNGTVEGSHQKEDLCYSLNMLHALRVHCL